MKGSYQTAAVGTRPLDETVSSLKLQSPSTNEKSVFEIKQNCWRTDTISKAKVLIDCANFYRALHKAFRLAQHTIFIVGWEVDSQVRLLRGPEEAVSPSPSVLLELLAEQAKLKPHLRIYILPWDSSVAFLGDREIFSEYSWAQNSPENIHFCLDQTMPLGGSQHQKLILIDDEVAFTGGMDIARQRWDERAHRIIENERVDENGCYGPYHDVQIVLTGPMVKNFSELVRWRWVQAAGYEARPAREFDLNNLTESAPAAWPCHEKDSFQIIQAAVARTFPQTDTCQPISEVHQMYLDLISEAKNFLYIENQFLSCQDIAHAINQQLHKEPQLKALFISSYNPQGIFESEGMWAARIDFKAEVLKGINPDRVLFAACGVQSPVDKSWHFKRIHSKVMAVDDLYLVVGSSNISNRSMSYDSECDLILHAKTEEQRKDLLFVRNDLISEHTGIKVSEVQIMFEKEEPISKLKRDQTPGQWSLHDLEDDKFTNKNFQSLATKIADPSGDPKSFWTSVKNPDKGTLLLAALAFVGLMLGVWAVLTHLEWFNAKNIENFLAEARNSPYAWAWVCGVYVVGGFIFFPVTLMSLITAAVFGSLWGPVYGMMGALTSASIMFALGRWAGLKGMRRLIGDRVRRIDHQFREAGIVAVTTLRMIPIAPFSLVNIAAGISSVRYFDFVIGTFFGFLPAFVVKGLVGDSLVQVFVNPTRQRIFYLCLGIVLWLALVVGSYFLAKRWRSRSKA